MNAARLRILVQIIRQNPEAIKQAQNEIKQLNRTAAMGGAAAGKLFGAFGRLEKLGKDLQWTGRQLEFRFTLPLILAGAAATKFAFDNERAFTVLKKVYTSGAEDLSQVGQELDQLQRAFELLSNIYGVQQAEVIRIGALWAQAGAKGTALAKATRATLDVMILGEMAYEDAANALIVLRAQYSLTADELKSAIATINVVENQAAVGFQDLIDGITRAGGTARTVGIDIRHLSALIAALVPATGSAASAGNGLKTILSRLFAPTKQAAEVMGLVGINVKDATWQAQNGAQRLETLAGKFKELTPAQQAYFSSYVAGRFQINRMDVLLRDIADPMGAYNQALKDTADNHQNLAKMQNEVNIFLKSNPQAFKQLTTVIQNELARAIVPLIPMILRVVKGIAQLVTWFTHLSPHIQKTALMFFLILAAIGPVIAYIGAFILMFSVVKKAFTSVGTGIWWVVKNLAGLIMKFFGVGAAATQAAAATEVAATAASGAAVTVQGVMAEAAASITTLGLGAGEGFVGGMATAMTLGIPEVIAAMEAQFAAIGTFGANSAFLIGGAIGEAFEAGILAAIGTTTPIKIAALEAQLAAVVAAGVPSALAAGGAIGAALEAGIMGSLAALAPAAGGAALVVGESVATGILAPIAALPAGAAGAGAAFIDVVGWEVTTGIAALGPELAAGAAGVGTEVAAGLSGGLLAGLIALAAAAGAAVTFVIAKTSDTLLEFLSGMWLTFFGGLPGFLLHVFSEPFEDALGSVMRMFGKLPGFVADVMSAVLNVIVSFAKAIWKALSYALNPWQRHSPSLVDLVTSGVDVILAKYESLRSLDIGSAWRKAAADIQRFNKDAKGITNAAEDRKINENVVQIAASDPGAAASAQAIAQDIRILRADLEAVTAAYAKQLLVVNKWERALNKASNALKEQQFILDNERYKLDQISNALDHEQAALDKWASTPIKGMRAMDDAIFQNEQSTKRLQLQLMDLEDTYGTIDGLKDKMNEVQGAMELISGQRNALRLKGAGSDVLAPFTEELDKLGKSKSGFGGAISQMEELQKQIEELQRKGERLDLERSLKFDGLTRQIEQAANAMEEMPFNVIIANVKKHKTAVDALTAKQEKQNRVVERQERIVDRLQHRVDLLQHSYDLEKQKLDDLGKAYDGINQLINELTSALESAGQAAQDMGSDIAEGFAAAGAGDFDDLMGNMEDFFDPQKLEDMLKELEKEWNKKFGDLKLDFTAPFKKAWAALKGWFGRNWKTLLWIVLSPFTALPFLIGKALYENFLKDPFSRAWEVLTTWWSEIAWPFISGIPGKIVGAFAGIGEKIKNGIKAIPGIIAAPFKKAWKFLFNGKESIPFRLGKLVGFFLTLPLRIIAAVGKLGFMLARWAYRTMGSLLAALPGAVALVMRWFAGLPGRIMDKITHALDLGARLIGWVLKAANNFVMSLPNLLKGALDWFAGLPQKILDAIPNTIDFLWQRGRDLVMGFFKGIMSFLKDLPGKVISALGGVAGAAGDFFAGVFEGAKFWAEGGINLTRHIKDSPHNAQIAKAGEMRIWAEPETGGEAYIPLAPSKRTRSLEIFHKVGEILGVGKPQKFAEGGIVTNSMNIMDSVRNERVNTISTNSVTSINKAVESVRKDNRSTSVNKIEDLRKAVESFHTARTSSTSSRNDSRSIEYRKVEDLREAVDSLHRSRTSSTSTESAIVTVKRAINELRGDTTRRSSTIARSEVASIENVVKSLRDDSRTSVAEKTDRRTTQIEKMESLRKAADSLSSTRVSSTKAESESVAINKAIDSIRSDTRTRTTSVDKIEKLRTVADSLRSTRAAESAVTTMNKAINLIRSDSRATTLDKVESLRKATDTVRSTRASSSTADSALTTVKKAIESARYTRANVSTDDSIITKTNRDIESIRSDTTTSNKLKLERYRKAAESLRSTKASSSTAESAITTINKAIESIQSDTRTTATGRTDNRISTVDKMESLRKATDVARQDRRATSIDYSRTSSVDEVEKLCKAVESIQTIRASSTTAESAITTINKAIESLRSDARKTSVDRSDTSTVARERFESLRQAVDTLRSSSGTTTTSKSAIVTIQKVIDSLHSNRTATTAATEKINTDTAIKTASTAIETIRSDNNAKTSSTVASEKLDHSIKVASEERSSRFANTTQNKMIESAFATFTSFRTDRMRSLLAGNPAAEAQETARVALAAGGVVNPRPGGVAATLAEAGRRELVTPLPAGFSMNTLSTTLKQIENTTRSSVEKVQPVSQGSTHTETHTTHFHGDLSFPNIKSGDDAEKFVRNLKSLVD